MMKVYHDHWSVMHGLCSVNLRQHTGSSEVRETCLECMSILELHVSSVRHVSSGRVSCGRASNGVRSLMGYPV